MNFSSWYRWLLRWLDRANVYWGWRGTKRNFPPAPLGCATESSRTSGSRNATHVPRDRLECWPSLNERRMGWGIR
jgi:hypothetical protein